MYLRPILFAGALMGALLSTLDAAASEQSDDPKWCRACHDAPTFGVEHMASGVHADLTCRDCHTGYHFNPHEEVKEPQPAVPALAAASPRAPGALAACSDCHAEVAREPGVLPHGSLKSPADGAPYCLDCHGEPHSITEAAKLPPAERRIAMNARCSGCHGDARRMEAAGLGTEVVDTYAESMHSRKLHLGSNDAPGCVDCHGGHEGRDMAAGRVEVCAGCHDAAGPDFASLATHLPLSSDDRPVAFYTQKFFAWLTFLTILFLSLHVLLDLFASIRAAARRAQTRGV